jgi:seryl-tRNA synthetase
MIDGLATPDHDNSFTGEFRELARQRRFIRRAEQERGDSHIARAAQPERSAPTVAKPRRTMAPAAQRMTDDVRTMLAELARMSDRLVEAREAAARAQARAEHAEHELHMMNDRLMAARALVHDAQRATKVSAERCAWLEGRCTSLEHALDVAVNASMLQRWRWRRAQRATTSST